MLWSLTRLPDFMDATDCFVTEQFPYPALLNPI